MPNVDWTKTRGANYLPSYGRDQLEFWLTRFDLDILKRELGFAQGLGLDSLRVFHSFDAWEENAEQYLANWQSFADECTGRGLKLLTAVFDATGTDRGGKAQEWVSFRAASSRMKEEASKLASWKLRVEQMVEAREGPAFPGDVEVPFPGSALALFCEGWRNSPGNARLGEAWRPRVRAYLAALVEHLGAHPAICAWDVMNEPPLANLSGEPVDVLSFLKWACLTLAELKPSAPLTVGCLFPEDMEKYDEMCDGALGVLSCHSYDRGEALEGRLQRAQAVAERRGKPWLLTECGNFEFPGNPALETDEAQEAIWADILPGLTEAKVGWFATHLIMGYGPFAGLALLYSNGTRRPAAHRVAKWLAEHDGRQVALRTDRPLPEARTTVAKARDE